MDYETKKRAACALMASAHRVIDTRGKMLGKCLPRIFVVGSKLYYFRNVALRTAYIEKKPVETMTALEAYAFLHRGKQMRTLTPIATDYDQTGGDFGGFLFSDNMINTEQAAKELMK